MPRIAMRSHSIHDQAQFWFLKAQLALGIAGRTNLNPNVSVRSAPSESTRLFARLNEPYGVNPIMTSDNSGGANLTDLTGATGMYEVYYSWRNPDGTTGQSWKQMLAPEDPIVSAMFAHFGEFSRSRVTATTVTTALAYAEPMTLHVTLRRGSDILLSTDPDQPATGPSRTIPAETYTAPDVTGITYPATTVMTAPAPILTGQTFSLTLSSATGHVAMPRGLLLTQSLGSDAETRALLGDVPAAATDLKVDAYLKYQWAIGYIVSVIPQPDVYTGFIPLGQHVTRVADFSVSGSGSPRLEYRVPPFVPDWTDAATPSDLPGAQASTGQDYNHVLEFRVWLENTDQRLLGLSFNVTEGYDFGIVTPVTQDLSPTLPLDWRAPDKALRAVASGKVVARHPEMPPGMGGLAAWTLSGTRVYPSRRGELLCFDTPGPHVTYWNPVPDGPPLPNLSESLYQATHATAPRGAWGAAEDYRERRNLVVPRFQVTVGGIDFSNHVVDFTPDSVTLAGPASVFENVTASVQVVQVSGPSQPIFTGRAVRTETRPYANGRVVTFHLLPNTEFYDADLTRVNLEGETIPTSEDIYVMSTLRQSGYRGLIQGTPGIRWRDTSFWQAPLPAGPGMELAEVESRYQNTQNASTLNTVKLVLQANLLDIYDLPNGDVLIDQLLPQVNTSLLDLLKTTQTVYCASSGTYVSDPRINISGVSLALDEGFTETEIEGFSNEVNLGIGKGLANFVQNYKQNTYYEFTFGGYESNRDFQGTDGDPVVPFQTLENGALRHEFFPVQWFQEAQVTPDESAIEVERTYQSGGFGGTGNKNVTRKSLIILSGEQVAQKWPARRNDIQEFLDQFMPALEPDGGSLYDTPEKRMQNARVAVGISGSGNGDYVSKATFHIKVNVGRPNDALINVVPLIGKFDARWAPDWFPPLIANNLLFQFRDLKPRPVRKISNPMIARIGSQYAVQKPNYSDGRIPDSIYDTAWNATANQLATWLTIKDLLKTRRVELSLAGAQAMLPNQFIFIARRPPGGPGAPVTHIDALLTLEPGRPDARVGSEAWTRVPCAFIGTIVNNEVFYDMPIGWGASWQE